jgi:hypothetical protein
MQRDLEYARLSGVSIPEALLTAVDDARTKLSNIISKKGELAGRKVAAQERIKESIRLEAGSLIGGDADGKLPKRRQKAEADLAGASALLNEMLKFERKAENELEQAEQVLQSFISDRLAEGRRCMVAHLDIVMAERARQLSNLRVGEVVRSSRPARNARSRIAVCEVCKQDIGIIDTEKISLPIRAEHFEKLARDDYPPFPPHATIEHFTCPRCRKKPWWEHDRILTNAGFYVVDSHEEPQGKKEEKNDV